MIPALVMQNHDVGSAPVRPAYTEVPAFFLYNSLSDAGRHPSRDSRAAVRLVVPYLFRSPSGHFQVSSFAAATGAAPLGASGRNRPFLQNLTGIIIQEGSLETSGNTVGRAPPHGAGGGATWRLFTEADVRGFVAALGELPSSTTMAGGVAGANANELGFTLWGILALSAGMMTPILSTLLNNQSHEAAAVIAGMPLLFLLGAVMYCVMGVLFKIRRRRFHDFFKTMGIFFFLCAACVLTLCLLPRAYRYVFLAILVVAAAVGVAMLLMPNSTTTCPLPAPPPAEGALGVSVPENGQYWFTKWLSGYNQSRLVPGNETTAEEFSSMRSGICV